MHMCYQNHFYKIFPRNSESNASELLDNLKEIFIVECGSQSNDYNKYLHTTFFK